MSYLKEMELSVTTNADGDGTVTAPRPIRGQLYAVVWLVGTLAGTVDAVFSTVNHDGADTNLLTLTNASANGTYYPRVLVQNNAGANLTGTAGGDRALPLLVGVPRLVIAQGGDTLAGKAYLYYFED